MKPPAAQSWTARPRLALAVRGAVLAVPLIAGVGAGVAATRTLPQADGPGDLALVWVAGFAVSTLVIFGVTRLVRRLLPLAALLELSLTFPDHTPSRLGVALRAGNLRRDDRHRAALRVASGQDRAAAVEAVLALAAALSQHDRATRGHSERVRAYTEVLCEELRLPAEDRLRLRWASLLHDVGKMAVPPAILNKNGRPDPDEWAVLQRHPEEGAKLTAALAPWLGPWAATIEQHHERWDGTGYPRGLAGRDIHQGARIVAVADAYEVMTAARAYKEPVSAAEARRRLAADAGRQFDPDVVRAFLNVSLGRLRVAAGPLAWLAQVPFLRPAASAARGPVPVALGGVLAATAITLAAPVAPADPPPAQPAAVAARTAPTPATEVPRAVELAVASPDGGTPPVPQPAAGRVPRPDVPPPVPAGPPPLATEVDRRAPEEQPTPPPAPTDPVPPAPPPDGEPLLRASVQIGEPVGTGLAVEVGDAGDAPPVAVELSVG